MMSNDLRQSLVFVEPTGSSCSSQARIPVSATASLMTRAERRAVGYSHARFHIHGLTRLDCVPLWAAYGLALERVHDLLTRSAHSAGHD